MIRDVRDRRRIRASVCAGLACTTWCLPWEEEIRHAALLCSRAKAAVVSMFRDARMGQAIDTAHASDLVDEISASVLRHPNALLSLVRLKTSDEYTYMHSVAVCALMIALARQLELPDPLVREAGLAGLLHDIGKMAVPDPILNKPGKLTDPEFGLVRRHPQNGARMLLDCRQVSALVVDVCLHHHERIDGTGYPFGLAQEQISLLARMGAVCDSTTRSPPTVPTRRAGTPPRRSDAWPNGTGTSTRRCSAPSSRRWASTRSARWSGWKAGASAWSSNNTAARC